MRNRLYRRFTNNKARCILQIRNSTHQEAEKMTGLSETFLVGLIILTLVFAVPFAVITAVRQNFFAGPRQERAKDGRGTDSMPVRFSL